MKRSLLFFALGLTLSACGSSKSYESDNNSISSTRLTYEFREVKNGVECTTKKQTSSNIQVLCQVLGDEKVNHNCAVDQRRKLQAANNCSNVTPVSTTYFFFGACENITGAVHHVGSPDAQCKALMNETLNAGCEKQVRLAMVKEFNCK